MKAFFCSWHMMYIVKTNGPEYLWSKPTRVNVPALTGSLRQEIAALYNGVWIKGNYKAIFGTTGFSSGVYLYQLKSESYLETR